MIEKVWFRNFKALRDVYLDLARFTVLVGPNASGKTSILEVLHYLSELQDKKWEDVFGGEEELKSLRTRDGGSKVEIGCTACGRENWFDFEINGGSRQIGKHYGFAEEGRTGAAGGRPTNKPLGPSAFGPAAFLRLDANRLAAPSYSERPVPQVESDGTGVASSLAYMASNEPDDYEDILRALRSVVPSVRNIRTPRARVVRMETEVLTHGGKSFTHRGEREYWGNSVEFDMVGAPGVPAHLASEGTLLVLGVLTALMGPERPRLVLLDDMDRALHPKAQGDLVALLRKLLDQNPDMQIVATSHSPYLLDHLKPEEVRLTTLKDDGSVACGRLDKHPEFDKWKETMTPGEFWSLVGEKWLVEAEAGEAAS